MPLYRDSSNSFAITFLDEDGAVEDISAREFRFEFYQPQTCKTVTLEMGDGLAFDTDGTDGVIEVTLSEARVNEFCTGSVRVRVFDDSGSDPVITHEGSDTIEGQSYDA